MMNSLATLILAVALLIFMNYVQDEFRFLHAWGVVKRIRVDRLEKQICDRPAQANHENPSK